MSPQTAKYLPHQNYVPLTQTKYVLPHCRGIQILPNGSPPQKMTCYQSDDLII